MGLPILVFAVDVVVVSGCGSKFVAVGWEVLLGSIEKVEVNSMHVHILTGATDKNGDFLLPFATHDAKISGGGSAMASRSIKLSERLIEQAIKDSKIQMRSTPMQIEFYYNLARLAEQYEDLPISMVKSLMVSTKEDADIEFKFKK